MTTRAVPLDSPSAAQTPSLSDHYAWTRTWLTETPLSPADLGEMTTKPWKVASFDSQDSAQSFRIAADHEGNVPDDRVLKGQLAVAMEHCTATMKNLLLPPDRRGDTKATMCDVSPEVASVAASIMGMVSNEMSQKRIDELKQSLDRSRKNTKLRKQELTILAEEKRHPLLKRLEGMVKDLRDRIRKQFCGNVELKKKTERERREFDRLKTIKEKIEIEAVSLRDVGEKYEGVVEENRVLRQTIRELKGDVQVMLRVPYRAGSYLEATNRDEVTLRGKKNRSFSVDGVVTGDVREDTLRQCLSHLTASFLDGLDTLLVGLSVGQKSSFLTMVAHTIDGLMAAREEQELDIEVLRLTSEGSTTVMAERNLSRALVDCIGEKRSRRRAVYEFLNEAFVLSAETSNDRPGHFLLRLRFKDVVPSVDGTSASTFSFLQLQPQSEEYWWKDADVTAAVSTLTDVSAKNVSESLVQTPLVQTLLEERENGKIYGLMLELANLAGYQKEDAKALDMASRIRSARVDGETKTRQRTIKLLKKKTISSNRQISKLTEEQSTISCQKQSLLNEIDALETQIAALQELKQNRQIRQKTVSTSHPSFGLHPNHKEDRTTYHRPKKTKQTRGRGIH